MNSTNQKHLKNAPNPDSCLGKAFKAISAGLFDRVSPQETFALWLSKFLEETESEFTSPSLRSQSWCGQDVHVFLDHFGRFNFSTFRCRKKTCPVCLEHWCKKLQSELCDRVGEIDPWQLRHITLTIPNPKKGDLDNGINQLYRSRREWINEGKRKKGKGGKWFDVEGSCAKLEVHLNPKTGWHPHLHMLVHAPRGVALNKGAPARELWSRITARYGPQASFRDGVFVTGMKQWLQRSNQSPHHESPETLARAAAREIGKYASKPIPLTGLSAESICELSNATRKRRFLSSTGTLQVKVSNDNASGLTYCGLFRDIHTRHNTDVTRKLKHDRKVDPKFGHDVGLALAQHFISNELEIPSKLKAIVDPFVHDILSKKELSKNENQSLS